MTEFLRFIQEHFAVFFGLNMVGVFLIFGWLHYRHRKYGIVFPPHGSVRVLYEERKASGCSHRSLVTRLGGCHNCLIVTVADHEVWIHTFFPLSTLARTYDWEHRIPREAITSVEPSEPGSLRPGGGLLLDYRQESGVIRRFELYLRDPLAFLAALNVTAYSSEKAMNVPP